MCTMLSTLDLSSCKVAFLRSCAMIGLALLLLIPMARQAGAQSVPIDGLRIAGDEGAWFGAETLLHAAGDSFLARETDGGETYESNQRLFTNGAFITSGIDLTLPSEGKWTPLESGSQEDPSAGSFQDAPKSEDPDQWHFIITPYIYLPSLSGNSTVRGFKSTLGETMSDVLDAASIAFFESFIAMKGKWFIYHHGFYAELEDDARVGPLKLESTSTQAMLDLALGHRVLEEVVHEEEGHEVTLDLYGGVRYQYLKSEIEIDALFINVDESNDWLEPLVGGLLKFDITDDFSWDAALLDFSGFGFGSASDLTVRFYSGINYRLGENYSLRFGYQLLSLDYDRGSGSERYSQDFLMNGPVIGLSFYF